MCDFLLLGVDGVGKSVFVRKLKKITKRANLPSNLLDTAPTLGVELDEIFVGKVGFTIREIGGSFIPVWPRYFGDCQQLLFMVDVSAPEKLADSTIELLATMNSEEMAGKPVILLLNKIDSPCKMTREYIEQVMSLDSLIETCERQFDVMELSSLTEEGLAKVFDELMERSQHQKKKGKRASVV